MSAIGVHWLMALLIIGGFALGAYVGDLPLSPQKLQLISYHKWIGITVLMLFVVRLLVRATQPVPAALPAQAWQQRAATATHGLLYLLMVLIPMSGWMMSSAKGFPVVYLGLIQLPDLVEKSKELGDILRDVHGGLNFGLMVLVALHVAAAIKHHVVDKDATLRRMSPFTKN
jgi:cytochrome b561